MRVVCDTNVWYGIYDNNYSTKNLADAKLLLTFNSLNEFRRSHNSKKVCLYKGVANTIIESHDEYLNLNPFQYIKSLDNEDWEPSTNHGKYIMRDIYRLANMSEEVLKRRKQEIDLDKSIDRGQRNVVDSTEYVNIILEDIKNNVRNLPKDQYRQRDLKDDFKKLISQWTEKDTGCSISSNFDWKRVELFMEVIECYFKDLALSDEKMNSNDWVDIFNLVYVDNGMKYWTEENKWVKIIERVGFEEYLFNPQI